MLGPLKVYLYFACQSEIKSFYLSYRNWAINSIYNCINGSICYMIHSKWNVISSGDWHTCKSTRSSCLRHYTRKIMVANNKRSGPPPSLNRKFTNLAKHFAIHSSCNIAIGIFAIVPTCNCPQFGNQSREIHPQTCSIFVYMCAVCCT